MNKENLIIDSSIGIHAFVAFMGKN